MSNSVRMSSDRETALRTLWDTDEFADCRCSSGLGFAQS